MAKSETARSTILEDCWLCLDFRPHNKLWSGICCSVPYGSSLHPYRTPEGGCGAAECACLPAAAAPDSRSAQGPPDCRAPELARPGSATAARRAGRPVRACGPRASRHHRPLGLLRLHSQPPAGQQVSRSRHCARRTWTATSMAEGHDKGEQIGKGISCRPTGSRMHRIAVHASQAILHMTCIGTCLCHDPDLAPISMMLWQHI